MSQGEADNLLDHIQQLLELKKQRIDKMEEQAFGHSQRGSLRDRTSELGKYVGFHVSI